MHRNYNSLSLMNNRVLDIIWMQKRKDEHKWKKDEKVKFHRMIFEELFGIKNIQVVLLRTGRFVDNERLIEISWWLILWQAIMEIDLNCISYLQLVSTRLRSFAKIGLRNIYNWGASPPHNIRLFLLLFLDILHLFNVIQFA